MIRDDAEKLKSLDRRKPEYDYIRVRLETIQTYLKETLERTK